VLVGAGSGDVITGACKRPWKVLLSHALRRSVGVVQCDPIDLATSLEAKVTAKLRPLQALPLLQDLASIFPVSWAVGDADANVSGLSGSTIAR
jgi:hypothetical protein